MTSSSKLQLMQLHQKSATAAAKTVTSLRPTIAEPSRGWYLVVTGGNDGSAMQEIVIGVMR
jgi:hypothetical protein